MDCSNDVDDQDQTQESSNAKCNVLGVLKGKASDFNATLVRSVGEIIVSGAGKVVLTHHHHLDQTTIKVGSRTIQLLAIGLRVLVVGLWITGHNLVLVQIGKSIHQGLPLGIIGVCLGIKEKRLLLQGQRNRLSP